MLHPIVRTLPAVASALLAAAMPNPYRHGDRPATGPAPVPVMEQVFWVELNVSPGRPTKVAAPDGVKLLDKTKPGKGRTRTRVYFRADRGMDHSAITVEIEGKPDVPLRCEGIEFQGSFGYWSESGGKFSAAHLVNGCRLRKGRQGIAEMLPLLRAKIAAVDFTQRTLRLDRDLPADAAMVGKLIYIRAGAHLRHGPRRRGRCLLVCLCEASLVDASDARAN